MDKKIRSNYIYSVLYQILGYVIPLVTAPYISRVLGAEKIGIVSYSRTIAQYFGLFALLGVNNYGNREIATHRDDINAMSRIFWSIYAFQCFTSVFSLIVYFCSYDFYAIKDVLIIKIQSFYIIGYLLDISWLFFGMEKFKDTVTRHIGIKIISLFLIFICVHTGDDTWKYALICSFGMVLSNVILWIKAVKIVKWKRPSIEEIVPHIKPIVILFIPVLTISLYKFMDKIMLGIFGNMVQLGLYENSEKIINIPMSLITALATVTLPRMSNIYTKGQLELGEKMIRDSMKFSMFLAIPITFGLIAISPIFVPLYFGRGYEGCVRILSYLAITVIFISWANVIRAQYLIPNRKEKEYIISVMCGAGINLVMNYMLIPLYGAVGAAIGTVFAEFFVMFSQILLTRKKLPYFNYLKDCGVFIGAAVLMYIGISTLRDTNTMPVLMLLIQVLMGAAIYLMAVLVFKLLLKYRKH